ncbi:glycosyltransferase family 4 protein [Lactobacillus rodentium]|uniref:Glycosyltransferase n=1 Tax=Lactobacillus rodentium TaxID=947835 RepID=A0A2Z6T835_9LACO|nr:glycosyltransferase family 4 protein [Lactobacillus rodentium]MCR1894758.1 glycosyltransferase family 4 protein [Lactobacillus rodentium]GBG04991.1 glycosyltransferase [Lactobacillus rodentium]
MRVAFFPSDNDLVSGAFRSMVTLIKILEENYNVIAKVYLPYDGNGIELLQENNLEYEIIPSYGWTISINEYYSLNKRIKWNIKKILNNQAKNKIKKELKKFKPDIVHDNTSWGYIGAKAAFELKIPVVWHIREFLEEDQLRRIWNKKSGYALMNKSDKIIAISDSINKKYKPLFGNKIQTIYNGIDDNKFFSSHDLFKNKDIKILTVGGLYPGKGHQLVIEALAILKKNGISNFKYQIVGKGEEEENLRKQVLRCNLEKNVEFCGFSQDPRPYYQQADIFILGSVSEAFGRVTVEAMMNGLLTIGRNSAATAEILKDNKYGLLFNDEEDLAGILKRIFTQQIEAKDIAVKGQEYVVKNYTAKKNAEKVFEVYQEILEN